MHLSQTVLSGHGVVDPDRINVLGYAKHIETVSLAFDARMIRAAIAVVSLASLFGYYMLTLSGKKRDVPAAGRHRQTTIWVFNVTRLVSTFALEVLSIIALVHNIQTNLWVVDVMDCAVYGYASVLALVVLFRTSSAYAVSSALTTLLFATFCVDAYRNIWPLATFTLKPADLDEGKLLWARIALLAYSGILVPLCIPRAYVPYNPLRPSPEPTNEQMASILSLKRDLELFEAGDQTEVGERGLTLSGGQKARVTLARAIYSSAENLLLDDVLAALDVHTARWIADKCFRGDLVRGRTIVLVTHNVSMMAPLADRVLLLNTNGTVASYGPPEESNRIDMVPLLKDREGAVDADHKDVDADAKIADRNDAGKLILPEEVSEGRITWDSWSLFFDTLGGNHAVSFWLAFLGLIFFSQILNSAQTFWMGVWSEQYNQLPANKVDTAYYLTIVVGLLLASCLAYTSGNLTYVYGIVRAMRRIHHSLVEAMLGTTLRWLDTTPVSRIITRCTQDIRAVETGTAHEFQFLVEVSASMVSKLVSVVILTPLFLIPGVLIAAVGGWIGRVYLAANMSVVREMNKARSPVIGHFGAAIAGLVSIRAYGSQDAARVELYQRIDHYNRAVRIMYNVNRWVGIRMDALSMLFSAAVAVYLMYGPGSESVLPLKIGFSLTMAAGFSGLILWWVRIFNAMESNANCLERLRAYIGIEQEPKSEQAQAPPAAWPTSGALHVDGLSACYSPTGPRVLQSVSFSAAPGERIGIVGRTGSGKSSLALALLRCITTDGAVHYDGVNTAHVNLDALRARIAVIPQMPELVRGTLRANVDPFSEHDDARLNEALRATGVSALKDARLTLDSAVASGGANVSVGQRQMIALARALVRGCKLLILDEATSAIDHETDALIQASLRAELGRGTTLLIVAHRLQTIMDADKILVLDAGRVVEFDAPAALLAKRDGHFRALVDQSGDAQTLLEIVLNVAA